MYEKIRSRYGYEENIESKQKKKNPKQKSVDKDEKKPR